MKETQTITKLIKKGNTRSDVVQNLFGEINGTKWIDMQLVGPTLVILSFGHKGNCCYKEIFMLQFNYSLSEEVKQELIDYGCKFF